MGEQTANKYIFYRNDQHQVNEVFDPRDPTCLDQYGYKYFGRVLNLLEPTIANQGITLIVTSWTVHELPEYGEKVIACLMQDEWAREVHYRDKVGGVFRTCGRTPINPQAFAYGNIFEKASNFLAQARAIKEDKGMRIKTLCQTISGTKLAPVFEMPIGYFAHDNIDYIPINERTNDLYFAGSIQHKKVLIKRPKEFSRERMGNALIELEKAHPHLKINSSVTGGYQESIDTDNTSYLRHMMNTKICPVPRGANLETYRFFEAISYGCIPVGEAFPKSWFYDDAPILRLKHWSDLKHVIPKLLDNPQELEQRHQDVLNWWSEKCSEAELANYMKEHIEKYVI